jgi:hypothetical protein
VFGNVGGHGQLLEGYTEDDPKLHVWFNLTKYPYETTLDGERVIEFNPVWDEIVIEIVSASQIIGAGGEITTKRGGTRGNRFDYNVRAYAAILIENLTNPDRKFEYE